jgi:hypothetical protein
MSTKINVRSPYYIKASDNQLAEATMELYIYTGEQSIKPDDVTYTITKKTIGNSNDIVFEISELVRDYLDIEFNGTYTSYTVWVEADITTREIDGTLIDTSISQYIAFDGYGYFEEGANPALQQGLIQSNKTIFRLNDQDVKIPVDTNTATSIAFYYNGELKRSETISTSTNTNQQIKYLSVSGSSSSTDFKQRVLLDGGTLEAELCIQDLLDTLDIGLIDEVWVGSDSGTEIVKIKTVDECKYEPIVVTFVNRFGALQDIVFFKKSIESLSVKGEQYKAANLNVDSYDTFRHNRTQFLVQGQDSITMNTGYLNDEYNKVIEELMLSEQVWMYRDGDTTITPIIPTTKQVTFKTSLNDRLVDYTISFDMAFDKINNIR